MGKGQKYMLYTIVYYLLLRIMLYKTGWHMFGFGCLWLK